MTNVHFEADLVINHYERFLVSGNSVAPYHSIPFHSLNQTNIRKWPSMRFLEPILRLELKTISGMILKI